MAWKKPFEELLALLAEALVGFDVQSWRIFGSFVYFVNDNMFAGVHQDNIMLRFRPEYQERLFAEHDEAVPFEAMGRKMKKYVLLPPSVNDNSEEILKRLNISFDYVFSPSLSKDTVPLCI